MPTVRHRCRKQSESGSTPDQEAGLSEACRESFSQQSFAFRRCGREFQPSRCPRQQRGDRIRFSENHSEPSRPFGTEPVDLRTVRLILFQFGRRQPVVRQAWSDQCQVSVMARHHRPPDKPVSARVERELWFVLVVMVPLKGYHRVPADPVRRPGEVLSQHFFFQVWLHAIPKMELSLACPTETIEWYNLLAMADNVAGMVPDTQSDRARGLPEWRRA